MLARLPGAPLGAPSSLPPSSVRRRPVTAYATHRFFPMRSSRVHPPPISSWPSSSCSSCCPSWRPLFLLARTLGVVRTTAIPSPICVSPVVDHCSPSPAAARPRLRVCGSTRRSRRPQVDGDPPSPTVASGRRGLRGWLFVGTSNLLAIPTSTGSTPRPPHNPDQLGVSRRPHPYRDAPEFAEARHPTDRRRKIAANAPSCCSRPETPGCRGCGRRYVTPPSRRVQLLTPPAADAFERHRVVAAPSSAPTPPGGPTRRADLVRSSLSGRHRGVPPVVGLDQPAADQAPPGRVQVRRRYPTVAGVE